MTTTDHETLDALAEEFADLRVDLQPLLGLMLGGGGDPRALPDVSTSGEQKARERLADLRERVAAVDADALDRTRATSLLQLLQLLDAEIAAIDLRTVEMSVDALASGPQAVLLMTLPKTPITSADDADDVARFSVVPTLLEDTLDQLRAGATSGRTATVLGVTTAVAQCRAVAASGDDSPFLLPLRPDDRIGLVHLDDGPALYAQALRQHSPPTSPPRRSTRSGWTSSPGWPRSTPPSGTSSSAPATSPRSSTTCARTLHSGSRTATRRAPTRSSAWSERPPSSSSGSAATP